MLRNLSFLSNMVTACSSVLIMPVKPCQLHKQSGGVLSEQTRLSLRLKHVNQFGPHAIDVRSTAELDKLANSRVNCRMIIQGHILLTWDICPWWPGKSFYHRQCATKWHRDYIKPTWALMGCTKRVRFQGQFLGFVSCYLLHHVITVSV